MKNSTFNIYKIFQDIQGETFRNKTCWSIRHAQNSRIFNTENNSRQKLIKSAIWEVMKGNRI